MTTVIGEFLKLVVQRGEAEKNGEKVLTKSNLGGIITELSNKSSIQEARRQSATAKTSSEKNFKKMKKALDKRKKM